MNLSSVRSDRDRFWPFPGDKTGQLAALTREFYRWIVNEDNLKTGYESVT